MSFASFPYLVFLVICFVIYFSLKHEWRALFLLLCSYLFYSLFGFGFAALMLITTLVTFFSSKWCHEATTDATRKLFFYFGLLFDLLVFVLFKYIHVIDIDIMNWPDWSAQKLLIPIGISFYTFKTVGYCIDIYKRKYRPESSFVHYALSVSFFPQLIAGPIEKSIVISKQLKKRSSFNIQNVYEGGRLILWGMFKKLVIADTIGSIINPCYSNITAYKGLDLVLIAIAFVYQIYADFSGYSDIAIGSAKCFGIDLPANFNKPYFSKNISDFWSRWHISFSLWLKEYVFNLLGGVSRKSKWRTIFNLSMVFLIVGFWHGATLNYMSYAALALIWFLLDIGTRQKRQKIFRAMGIKRESLMMRIINYVMIITMFSSLSFLYRPNSISDSMHIVQQIGFLQFHKLSLINVMLIIGAIIFLEILQVFQLNPVGHCFERPEKFGIRLFLYLVLFFSIILVSARPDITFQYFQF